VRDGKGDVLGILKLGDPDDHGNGVEEYGHGGTYQLGQGKMSEIFLREIRRVGEGVVDVRFGWKCMGIEDDEGSDCVYVIAKRTSSNDEEDGEIVKIPASYVLATDGTSSTIRRSLSIPFNGTTFQDFKMLGTDILFDFRSIKGWGPLTFFVDENDWGVVAYTGQNGDGTDSQDRRPMWRVALGEEVDLPDGKEEILERARDRISRFVGVAREEFAVVRAERYFFHQRCAEVAKKGRVCFAGDALHTNNPIGGLGLTTGIIDAHIYGNVLSRAFNSSSCDADALLTEAAESRRSAWLNATGPASMANLNRLRSMDKGEVAKRDEFFRRLREDPEFWREVRKGMEGMFGERFLS